jgi:hypothetical protein
MAQAQSPTEMPAGAPVTEEAFYADRVAFWSFFTGLTFKVATGVVVLLILLAIFLL